ncbi:MAG: type II toxin-antitoxin system Phd/YefM family antitoxin [Spirochaetaceae bacterium]|nr:type II toxin-antitoxin system Phd/YefM family antitoxin [Spirochaetaceae bacterium]
MRYSATKFRQNLYHILDMVIDEGKVIEIERKGQILKIVAENPPSKWDRLEPHKIINGNSDSIVHMDWSENWSGGEDV